MKRSGIGRPGAAGVIRGQSPRKQFAACKCRREPQGSFGGRAPAKQGDPKSDLRSPQYDACDVFTRRGMPLRCGIGSA